MAQRALKILQNLGNKEIKTYRGGAATATTTEICNRDHCIEGQLRTTGTVTTEVDDNCLQPQL